MIKLNEIKDKYKTDPINAVIEENTIIPGINGKEINIRQKRNLEYTCNCLTNQDNKCCCFEFQYY